VAAPCTVSETFHSGAPVDDVNAKYAIPATCSAKSPAATPRLPAATRSSAVVARIAAAGQAGTRNRPPSIQSPPEATTNAASASTSAAAATVREGTGTPRRRSHSAIPSPAVAATANGSAAGLARCRTMYRVPASAAPAERPADFAITGCGKKLPKYARRHPPTSRNATAAPAARSAGFDGVAPRFRRASPAPPAITKSKIATRPDSGRAIVKTATASQVAAAGRGGASGSISRASRATSQAPHSAASAVSIPLNDQ